MSALIPAPAGALATLPESARILAAASLTTNTRRAYSGALARLDSFLAAYLATLHDAGRAPAVAGQAVAAAKLRAKLAGRPSPAGPATDRVLAGFRREARHRGRGQVAGIRWEQADAIGAVAANGRGSLAGLRDAAIVALMSDAMLRVSEVAALDCADLGTETDGSGRLTIRYSKTDQKGAGAVQFIGSPTVRRVQVWLDAAGHRAGPMFRRVQRGAVVGNERMADRSLRRIIARRAADAGVEGRISGHSLRVGAAQSLAAAGASVVDMQTAGRWKSPEMPARYARGQLAARGAVARLRYGA